MKQSLLRRYKSLRGRCIGVLGLTYKPGTNTLRRSIAEEIISGLVDEGAEVRAYDPLADLGNGNSPSNFIGCPDPYALAAGCDALVLVTGWDGILELDWPRLRSVMRQPVFIDTRNLFDPEKMSRMGFTYSGIGRRPLLPKILHTRSL